MTHSSILDYTGLGRHTRNALRLTQVLQVLIKHGFAGLVRRVRLDQRLPAKLLRGLNLEAPEGEPETFGLRMRAALTELGPSFIKFGQILSTRPDLIGADVARELSALQDAVAPLPFELMAPVIEESFGAPIAELFAAFDTTPVASASLAQVYKAELFDGEEVAVKVRRPRIEYIIEADIRLMRQIAQLVDSYVDELHWIDLPALVEEFGRNIRRELDFLLEARAIEQFSENFAHNDLLLVPRLFCDWCTSSVLTMEWIHGVRVDTWEEYETRNCVREIIAENGCKILCEMIFEHGLFHGDPHPGNIFITKNNQLALLDYGMVGHLDKSDAADIADLFYSVFKQDSKECVEALLVLTMSADPENRDALQHEISEFIALEAEAIVSSGQIAKGLERAIEILRRHHLQLAPRFSLLIKALATIEHVAHQLDPKMDMLPILKPYIQQVVSQRYNPFQIAKDTQQSLASLQRLLRQLPQDLTQLFRQLRRGSFKVHIHHEHLDQLSMVVDRSSNRISVSLIVAALIVGSSIMVRMEGNLSNLGVAGFICAGLLGFGVVGSILWSRKI